MTQQPMTVAVFDIIETVFSLAPVREALKETGLAAGELETWFAFGLRDAFALDATRDAQPFPTILRSALDQLLAVRDVDASNASRQAVMEAFGAMPAQDGAAEAFALLRSAGWTIVALSNGPAARTASLLERAGLKEDVSRILGVEDVGRFKPHEAVYRQVMETTGRPASMHCMVACHAWDTHGAKRAGLRAAFIRRGQVYPPTMAKPDFFAEDLLDATRQILRFGSAPG